MTQSVRRLSALAVLFGFVALFHLFDRDPAAQRRPPEQIRNRPPVRRSQVHFNEDQSPGVLTYHNDWGRTGQNLLETTLTPNTVTAATFGLLKTDFQLDGLVLAQPLYVPNVVINGSPYNIVVVVTEHDTVYAFDADVNRHPQNWASPLWTRSLLNPGATPVPTGDQHDANGVVCAEISPESGISSTPVVDPTTNTLYVVARSKEADQSYAYTLHALSLSSGLTNPAIGGPTLISATNFDSLRANQRAGLALADGFVYVAFASYCDQSTYHGWVFGFDTTSQLAQTTTLNATPEASFGGIWNSGGAPAIDTDGTMFVVTGNASYDPGRHQWGDTILKLAVDRPTVTALPELQVLDHFTPFNQELLGTNDLDLGSGGLMLVPEQQGDVPFIAVGGGKQGLLYLVNRDQLTDNNRHHVTCSDDALQTLVAARLESGRDAWTDTCDRVQQAIKNTFGVMADATLPSTYRGPGIFSTPAYWNGSVYLGAANDNLKMFTLNDDQLVNQPTSLSTARFGWPGVTPSISSAGNDNGIAWVIDTGDVQNVPAVLYAFDARDLSHILYKSSGTPDDERAGISPPGGRDAMPPGRRFAVPTVYGGKVFVASRTTLYVFGLL